MHEGHFITHLTFFVFCLAKKIHSKIYESFTRLYLILFVGRNKRLFSFELNCSFKYMFKTDARVFIQQLTRNKGENWKENNKGEHK